jgi:hypothetical protein
MTDSAIVMTYTRAAPGREEQALESFTEGMAFFASAAHDGKCEEPINFMGSSGHSMMIVPGEWGALTELVRTDDFQEIYVKSVFAVPDLAYELGVFGQGVQDYMARWAKVGTELSFM